LDKKSAGRNTALIQNKIQRKILSAADVAALSQRCEGRRRIAPTTRRPRAVEEEIRRDSLYFTH
jgi:hypothetical protein